MQAWQEDQKHADASYLESHPLTEEELAGLQSVEHGESRHLSESSEGESSHITNRYAVNYWENVVCNMVYNAADRTKSEFEIVTNCGVIPMDMYRVGAYSDAGKGQDACTGWELNKEFTQFNPGTSDVYGKRYPFVTCALRRPFKALATMNLQDIDSESGVPVLTYKTGFNMYFSKTSKFRQAWAHSWISQVALQMSAQSLHAAAATLLVMQLTLF